MQCCRVADLCSKQVINTKNGCRLGFVSDVELNVSDGSLAALIIRGRERIFSFGKREDDIKICRKDIQVIGDDTILVCGCEKIPREKKPGSFADNFFS